MQFLLSLLFIKKSFLNILQGVFKRMTTTQDQRLILNIIGVNKLTVLYLFTLTCKGHNFINPSSYIFILSLLHGYYTDLSSTVHDISSVLLVQKAECTA